MSNPTTSLNPLNTPTTSISHPLVNPNTTTYTIANTITSPNTLPINPITNKDIFDNYTTWTSSYTTTEKDKFLDILIKLIKNKGSTITLPRTEEVWKLLKEVFSKDDLLELVKKEPEWLEFI